MKYGLIELIPFIVVMSLILYVVNDLYLYMGLSRITGVVIFSALLLLISIMRSKENDN